MLERTSKLYHRLDIQLVVHGHHIGLSFGPVFLLHDVLILCETLLIDIMWESVQNYRIISFLHSITFFDKLQNACDSVQPHLHNYEGDIILGDFNINWQIDSASTAHLQEIANSLELAQVVEDVTRPSNNSSSSGPTIDLIFTNRPEKFAQVESFANPVSSDHHAVHFTFSACKVPPPPMESQNNNVRLILFRAWPLFSCKTQIFVQDLNFLQD